MVGAGEAMRRRAGHGSEWDPRHICTCQRVGACTVWVRRTPHVTTAAHLLRRDEGERHTEGEDKDVVDHVFS